MYNGVGGVRRHGVVISESKPNKANSGSRTPGLKLKR